MTVRPIDVHDDTEFTAWYAALREGATAGRHAPLVVTAQALRGQLLNPARVERRAFGFFDGDRCLGTGTCEWGTEQNTHLGELDVVVRPGHRRRGIGTALLQPLLDEAERAGLSTLVDEVDAAAEDWPGLAFARAHGFRTVHTEDHLVLDLPLAAERLTALAAGDRAGYTVLSWAGATPVEQLTTMAALRTGMNAEVPTGDVDIDPEVLTADELADRDARLISRGYQPIASMALAADGTPAGYSLIHAQAEDVANAMQDDTYVLSAHRGHRLGALLKATNLTTLQIDVPEARYVHTWTDETNSPMQAINARFGFARVETMHEVQRGGR